MRTIRTQWRRTVSQRPQPKLPAHAQVGALVTSLILSPLATFAPAIAAPPASASAAARNCHAVADATVSRWRGQGNTKDSVGDNDGHVVGTLGYTRGVRGRAFLLTGDGHIEVPDDPSLDLAGQYTLTAWVKFTHLNWFMGVLGKRPGGGEESTNYGINAASGFGLGYYFDDPNYGGVGDDGNQFEVVRAPVPVGRFFHLAVTVRQLTGEQVRIRMYVNGKLAASRLMPGDLNRTLNSVPLTIGDSAEGNERMVGVLDEVAIYRRALRGNEIAPLARRACGGR